MKKYVIFLVLLIATLCVKAQSIIPQVNENVELMSILSRMAGFPEYHMDMAGQYIKDMDSYFKESTDHPAVQYMKGLRNKYGIAYDAVMSMAVHLDNRNGVFSLIEEEVSTLEKRWKKVDKDEFCLCLISAAFIGIQNSMNSFWPIKTFMKGASSLIRIMSSVILI